MTTLTKYLLYPIFLSFLFTSRNDGPGSDDFKSNGSSTTCSRSIKYRIEKIKFTSTGKEVKSDIDLVVNPTTKKITLTTIKNKAKVGFDTEISSIDCTLDETLTGGQAKYSGFVVQKDNSRSTSVISIRIKNGQILISEDDPENGRESKYDMIVSKWEFLE